MTRNVGNHVKKCHKCQKAKFTKHTKTHLTITETPLNEFDRVLVVTFRSLPKSDQGSEYSVTLICDLTKHLVTISIPDKSARTVAKALLESFTIKYDKVKTFITDMGTE